MAQIMTFKKPEEEKPVEDIVALAGLTDGELVRLMVEVIDAMRARSPKLQGFSMRDHDGRVWSMVSIMRYVKHKLDYIDKVIGVGVVR